MRHALGLDQGLALANESFASSCNIGFLCCAGCVWSSVPFYISALALPGNCESLPAGTYDYCTPRCIPGYAPSVSFFGFLCSISSLSNTPQWEIAGRCVTGELLDQARKQASLRCNSVRWAGWTLRERGSCGELVEHMSQTVGCNWWQATLCMSDNINS